MPKTSVAVRVRDSRQAQLERLEVGDCLSLARRVDLIYGVPEGALAKLTDELRATMDVQVNRLRRHFTERTYAVQIGKFVTQSGEIMLVVVCTRTE